MPADLSLHTIHLSIQTGDVQQWIRWNYSSAVVSLLAGQCTPTIGSQPHMPTSTRMAIRFPPLSKITLQQVNRFVKLAIFELTKYCSFINLCLTQMNVWESMGKPCSYAKFIKNRTFCYKSHENLCQVLQVRCTALECAMNRRFVW